MRVRLAASKKNRKMKKNMILILGIFFAIGVSGQNYSDSLTMEFTRHFASSNLPGFSVALVVEDEVLYKNSFGFANKENQIDFETTTIQNLGSVSKTVVGLALVKAIEDGKLSMDTEINDILPFKVQNPRYKKTPILIRHLATHTSSILDTKHYRKSYVKDENIENEGKVNRDFVNFLKLHKNISLKDFLFKILNKKGKWYKRKNFLKAKPGTQKEYSNLNAALAAYIIEIATETPFEEYTKKKIFEPLKMQNTYWNTKGKETTQLATLYFPKGTVVPRYRLITYPDGGLHSNSDDLVMLLKEVIKAYSDNSTYLPLKYAKLLLPGDNDMNRAFWGMRERNRTIGHEGSDPGTQTDMRFKADTKIGRIILTNVNAEDNEVMYQQFLGIHDILDKYEHKLIDK